VDNVTAFDCQPLVATGSTQGTAAAIASDTVDATSTGTGQGCILPGGCYRIHFWNNNAGGGNPIAVYPPTGGTIDGSTVNAPTTVGPQTSKMFLEVTSGKWRTQNVN